MSAVPLALLLDLDGTVIDSEPGILASGKAALQALGHPADDLEMTSLIGPPLEEVMAAVLARFGDDRVDEAVKAYRAHYGETGYKASTAYPGMAAALDQLAGLGAALYIATSKRRVFAERILEHLGLADRFVGIHGSEPDGNLDHKPELIAHVLSRQGLRPAASLMVGDRRHDVAGALANGFGCVGVLWGYGDRDELEAAGAAHIAERPGDVVDIVGRRLGAIETGKAR